MSGKKCVYFNCNNARTKESPLSFFRFPTEDEVRYILWKEHCGNPLITSVTKGLLHNKLICEEHFNENDMYMSGGRKLLRKHALPFKCKKPGPPNEENLISLVEAYKELYVPHHPQYNDVFRREAIWKEIGRKLRRPANKCRNEWVMARNKFKVAWERHKSETKKDLIQMGTDQLDKNLSFMLPYLNKERSDHGHASTSSSSKNDANFNNDTSYHSESSAPCEESEDVIDVFAKLGETVKTFPVDLRARVQQDVMRIVEEAKIEMLVLNLKEEEINVDFDKPEYCTIDGNSVFVEVNGEKLSVDLNEPEYCAGGSCSVPVEMNTENDTIEIL